MTNHPTGRRRLLMHTALCLAASTLAGQRAQAADADTAPHPDDIVVTAQHRSEPLAKVPVAISVLSAEALAKADAHGLQDIAAYTPNMTFNSSSGAAMIYLRGVGSNISNFSTDGSVAVNIDGVYVARPAAALLDTLDVDRIEVLKGPQGTLYGRNATAGAINIISKRPTATFGGYVDGIYSSFNRVDLQGAIGGKLDKDGDLRLRVAGRFRRDDGFTKNLAPGGGYLDNQNIYALRAALDADHGILHNQLTVDFLKQHSDGDTVRILDGSGQSDAVGVHVPADFHSANNNLPTFNDNKTYGVTDQLTVDLGGVSLVSVSGYRHVRQYLFLNTDGTQADVSESIFYTRSDQLSQELRLQSAAGQRFTWALGGYYFHEAAYSAISLPRYSGVAGSVAFPYSSVFAGHGITNAYAAFFDGTFHATPKLALTAGLRYSLEDKSLYRVSYLARSAVRDVLNPAGFGTQTAQRRDQVSYHAWTPRVVVSYQATPELMLYASANKGFKSGGANIAAAASAPYANEILWSYEGGAKFNLPARHLYLAADVFRYDYSNLQVTTYQNGLNTIQNAAGAGVWGVEGEVRVEPLRGLQLAGSAAWLDAKYSNFNSSLGGVPVAVSGNTMIGAPRWSLSGNATYTFALGPKAGSVSLYGAVNYRTTTQFNQFNFANMSQGAYALVDTRVTWTPPGGRLSVSTFVKNLFDKDYLRNIAAFTSISSPAYLAANPQGTALGYPGPGREVGGEVRFQF